MDDDTLTCIKLAYEALRTVSKCVNCNSCKGMAALATDMIEAHCPELIKRQPTVKCLDTK